MVAREYQGAGGLRLHLEEPLSDEMAKQVARGHLVPVADAEQAPEPEAPASSPESPADVQRPAANAKVDEWRAYAVSLGMSEDDAKTATKADCQDYVTVVEQSDGQE